jgi:sulfatase modifying factor 1
MYGETMQLPDDLVEQVHKGNLVLFLGNDMPHGFPEKAPPSRSELTALLSSKLGQSSTGETLRETAQRFELRYGKNNLTQQVIDQVKRPEYKPHGLHRQIAKLPFRVILTTGYDTLIEQALQESGKRYFSVLGGVEIPYVEDDQVIVYYLNGNVTRPDSLVLTTKDFIQSWGRLRPMFDVLRYLFQTRPLLFLNHQLSIEDDEFQRLFHEVTRNLDYHRRQAFAAWSNPDSDVELFWRGEHLTILDTDSEKLLDALAIEVSKRNKFKSTMGETRQKIIRSKKSPYKFLDFYDEGDADIFFGRETEIVRFWRMALSNHLAVLFGPSGAGKTSLLMAGVMPRLRNLGYSTLYIRALDDLSKAICSQLLESLRLMGRAIPDNSEQVDLAYLFNNVLHETDQFAIVIDQFEEFFQRQNSFARHRFWIELSEICGHPVASGPPCPDVRVILSIREDFLPFIDEARQLGLDLFNNSYRLTNLSEDKASLAITEPAAAVGLQVEPELVKRLLSDLTESRSISPPKLQIVCDSLYRHHLALDQLEQQVSDDSDANPTLALSDYEKLGGAQKILAKYVDDALDQLPKNQRAIADAVFRILVTSKSTKAVLSFEEILESLSVDGLIVRGERKDHRLALEAMQGLQKARLIREIQSESGVLFELAHDFMASQIASQMSEEEIANRLTRELLRRETESWQAFGKYIERGSLALIHERRHVLSSLNQDEMTLLFQSALKSRYEIAYWARRATDAGINVLEISTQEAQSENFRCRVAGLIALGQLGDQGLVYLGEALSDPYPQVRAEAIGILINHASPVAWNVLQSNLCYECYIPAGEFTMGIDLRQDLLLQHGAASDTDLVGSLSEQPSRSIYLDAFWIDKYPVTNADFARFLADNPGYPTSANLPERIANPESANLPVTNVSWVDANAYLQWAGKRLPTEAEWEKAARGSDQRTFPWGSTFDPMKCNTRESKIGHCTPVGCFSPAGDSPFNVADMCGNVWEWTQDWYDPQYYSQFPEARNPLGPAEGKKKVLRGGSFRYAFDQARTFSRFSRNPGLRSDDFSFRGVL